MAPTRSPRWLPLARAALAASAMASLALGVWGGLLRLGWALPAPEPSANWLSFHGPLMVAGFLGTLIGLERALALASPWALLGPALGAAGAIWLLVGGLGPTPRLLLALASLALALVSLWLCRLQPSLAMATMALGAAAWLAAQILWWRGWDPPHAALLWVAFLVLTIAGERLALSRILVFSKPAQAAFLASAVTLLAGAGLSLTWPELGARVAGCGLLALGVWLRLKDLARRTRSQPGQAGYVARTLGQGFAWLIAGGALLAILGPREPGPLRDAALHALLAGFTLSMVFAHAPIIFPALAGRPLRWSRGFYLAPWLLHLSLALRLSGDLVAGAVELRAWGALGNAAALAVFIATVLRAALASPRPAV